MNGVQNGKARDLQKPFPGCMGRMISMFDLSSGVTGTKLLTEKPHRDGSPIRKSQPDVIKKMDPVRAWIGDKPIASTLRSSSKSDGTPMKMLLAQEMSKVTESKHIPPNVVARLMGLDALPIQQSALNAKINSPEAYSRKTLAGALWCYRPQEDECYNDLMPRGIQSRAHEKVYKDVYEVQQKLSITNWVENRPPQKGRYIENLTEKRMALVRQKFIEAKRLATDGKLIRSKEFRDVLEVLSSNRDLFLKFLDEPNPLFAKHILDFPNVSPLSQTKRITLLKPARTVELEDEKQAKKHQYLSAEGSGREMSKNFHQKADNLSQQTRIVVLKPSPGKPLEIKNMAPCPVPSPKLLDAKDFCGGRGIDEALRSRELAKEITQHMQEGLHRNNRDDPLRSSVLSNGYVGDDSSFNRSENDCIDEDGCNFSDSEIVTPNSRHSLDSNNRLDSPHSISSFSRASYSPESTVIREAKKRLSERWALVASNGINHERRQERRSSSTLGEMLAIPEVNKEEGSDGLTALGSRLCGIDEDSLSIVATKEGCSGGKSPMHLSRSKSVPISSTIYESTGVKEEVSHSLVNKPMVPKGVVKPKGGKSSFTGKVSSLFFSKIKKPGREKSITSPLVISDAQSGSVEAISKRNNDMSISSYDNHSKESTGVYCEEESGKASISVQDCPNQRPSSLKAVISLEEHRTSEKSRKNQDQPSPISVLEAVFKDAVNNNVSRLTESSIVGHPQALSRSPLIESLARSLSWDGTCSQTSLPKKHSTFLSEADEEQERFVFVQKLLSSARLDHKSSTAVFAQWHSLCSPLDPILLDEFLAQKEEEAKCRARRSNQKLLFDCVNAALSDIGHSALMSACPWARACGVEWKGSSAGASMMDVVWELVRDWSSGEGEWPSGEVQNSSLVIDRLVKREVGGRGRTEWMWSEIDEFGKEIGGKVLDELVEEALSDLTDGCL